MKKRIFTFIMASAIGLSVCAGQMPNEKLKADFTPTATMAPIWESADFWSDSSKIKTSGDYEYHILSEEKKMITIRKIKNAKGKVVIPKEIDGYKVVGIGRSDIVPLELKISKLRYVFDDLGSEALSVLPKSSAKVTEITIPSQIRFVGISAFKNSKNLKKVKINKRSTNLYLYEKSFEGCRSLQDVNLPEKTLPGKESFSKCGTIDKVTAGMDVISLDEEFGKTGIKVLKLENKKKNYDISECKKLKIGTVYVGKNVKKLIVKDTITKYSGNDRLKIDKLIVKGKNTVVEGWNKKHQFLGKLYTVSGSKAVRWAKKNKIAYKVLT